jgi:membrane fusion protein, copper/silver efflux system
MNCRLNIIIPLIVLLAIGCKQKYAAEQHEHGSGESVSGAILLPANQHVLSALPTTSLKERREKIEMEALGFVTYDTRGIGSLSARVAGRIEKLYVRHRYQKVQKGDPILDIYSPELLTAQQNLLFLLQNDAGNEAFISAAKEKLTLLGMTKNQQVKLIRDQKPHHAITIYSPVTGHLHDAGGGMKENQERMDEAAPLTAALSLREGMYLQKGQTIFELYDPGRAWVILNVFPSYQSLLRKGLPVRIIPEAAPAKNFRARIDFIEPAYRPENKTLSLRIYFDNRILSIPMGSQVRATIFGDEINAQWLPATSVVNLGLDEVVFLKTSEGFQPTVVKTGIRHRNWIQISAGLKVQDSVAVNAQYLVDSESFIKPN